MLFDKGSEAAENWLRTSFRHVGTKSTINIRQACSRARTMRSMAAS